MITLPKVEEVPECANDKMVYKTIVSIFKKYREQYEAPISEFDNELLWLLNFVDNRAVNKPYVLFKCGFVFHQEKVGILGKVSLSGETFGDYRISTTIANSLST